MKKIISIGLAFVLCLMTSITAFATTSPVTDVNATPSQKFATYVGSEFDEDHFFLAPTRTDDNYLSNKNYSKTRIEITTTSVETLELFIGYYINDFGDLLFDKIYDTDSGQMKKEFTVSASAPLTINSSTTDTITMSGQGYVGVAIKNASLTSDVSITVKVTGCGTKPVPEAPDEFPCDPVTHTFLAPASTPAITKVFPLTKDFVWAAGYDNAGSTITDIHNKVETDATFVIAPHMSFNREVGKTDIPTFSQSSYTIPVSSGTNSINITTPDYSSAGIGDYWYTVTEQSFGKTAGVNVDETNPRYLHVQVVWDATAPGGMKVSSVTLHAAAPNADGTYNTAEINTTGSDKTTGFTNTYGAGSLAITKQVTGNMGDPNKLFKVTVKLIHPLGPSGIITNNDGKNIMGDISYSGGFADAAGTTALAGTIAHGSGWGAIGSPEKIVVVYLKAGATVTFTNIPDGVTYEVIEEDYSGEGYSVAYAGGADTETGDTASATKFTGLISDSNDTVTITNNKDVAIDVGINLDNAPFIILFITSVAFFAVYFVTKRRKEEEIY